MIMPGHMTGYRVCIPTQDMDQMLDTMNFARRALGMAPAFEADDSILGYKKLTTPQGVVLGQYDANRLSTALQNTQSALKAQRLSPAGVCRELFKSAASTIHYAILDDDRLRMTNALNAHRTWGAHQTLIAEQMASLADHMAQAYTTWLQYDEKSYTFKTTAARPV